MSAGVPIRDRIRGQGYLLHPSPRLVWLNRSVAVQVAPLAFQTYYPGRAAWLLWLGVLHSCIRV